MTKEEFVNQINNMTAVELKELVDILNTKLAQIYPIDTQEQNQSTGTEL